MNQTQRTRFLSALLLSFLSLGGLYAQYCIPTYQTGTLDGDYLDGVQLGTISNLGSGSAGGPDYNDYTSVYSTSLMIGGTYTMTLYNTPDFDEYAAAWIDYNQNNTFDPAENLGEILMVAGGTGTMTFTVPVTATVGSTRLRVRLVYGTTGIDPCNTTYFYGETEDYGIDIISYCTPAYVLGTANGNFIDGVSFAGLNNPVSGSTGGPSYNNYTGNFSTFVNQGVSYNLSVTNGITSAYLSAWIDFNQDGIFDVTELVAQSGPTAGGAAYSTSVTIPLAAPIGTTRLRVRSSGTPVTDPCLSYNEGEAEDYTLVILGPPVTDLEAFAIVSPQYTTCTTEDLILRVKNVGTVAINMSLTPISVDADVTGALNTTFPTVVANTGILNVGDSLDIVVAQVNMSASGPYDFSATATVSGDAFAGNDVAFTSSFTEPTYVVPYLEDFDNQNPLGWLQNGFFTYPANAHGNASPLIAANLYSFNAYTEAFSPKIGAIAATNYLLFDYRVVDYGTNTATTWTPGAGDSLNVYVSNDCGQTFSFLYSINASNHVASASMASVLVPLAANAGDTVIFAFVGIWGAGGTGDYFVDVDNVEVRDVFPIDLQMVALTEPTQGLCATASQTVSVEMKNLGTTPISNIPVVVNYVVNGVPGSVNANISGPLNPGQSTVVQIGTMSTLPGGAVSFTASATIPGDGNPTDNSLSSNVNINTIPATPVVAGGTSVCAGTSATLNASGNGTTGTYRWFDAGGNLLFSGNPFTTPVLAANTTYQVNYTEQQQTKVGKIDNSGVGGAYTFFGDGLMFDVFNPITIDSVLVYPGSAGTVAVNLMDDLGTILSTVSVTVNPATPNAPVRIPVGITVSAPGSYMLDANGSTVSDLFRNSGGAVYPYNDPLNNVSITEAINGLGASGYYYFFYDWSISTLGCSSDNDTVSVTVTPSPTVSLAGNATTFCQGGSLTLNSNPQSPTATYSWSNGSNTDTTVVTAGGTYTLFVDDNGCTGSDTLTVTASPLPVVDLGQNVSACSGTTVTLSIQTPPAGSTIVWTPAAGSNPSVPVTTAGSYAVEVTTAQGCTGSDTVDVIFNPTPSFTLGNDTTLCGGSLTLTPNPVPATGSMYSWSTGATTPSITVSSAGNYALSVANSFGCTGTANIDVTFNSITATPSITQPSCTGATTGSVALPINGGTPPYTISWSNGASGSPISGLAPGTYTANVTDATGCTTTANATVAYTGAAPSANFSTTTNGLTVNFTNNSTGGLAFTWNFGDGSAPNPQFSPSHTYPNTGGYSAMLIVSNNCGSDTMTMDVVVTNSIDNAWFAGVSVYPNPVKDKLNIAMENVNFEDLSLALYDAKGGLVSVQNIGKVLGNQFAEMDLSKLSQGNYLLKLQSGDKLSFVKIVKE